MLAHRAAALAGFVWGTPAGPGPFCGAFRANRLTIKPALLNDLLTVTAEVKRVGRARLEFDQAVMRGEESAWRAAQ